MPRLSFIFYGGALMATFKEHTQNALNKIKDLITSVSDMDDQDFKLFLKKTSLFHNYSWNNRLILMLHGASQVAGYHQWKKFGRHVKKGAKAIWILAPRMIKFKDQKTDEDKTICKGFLAVKVFDIKDTDGKPLPDSMTTSSQVDLKTILSFTESLGYKVDKKPLAYSLGGYINDDGITLNSNKSELDNIGTLIHELAHGELGHVDSHEIRSADIKEQQAETVTYLVCERLGIERHSEFYLKAWKLSDDILKDFEKIHKVSEKIIKGIDSQSLLFSKVI